MKIKNISDRKEAFMLTPSRFFSSPIFASAVLTGMLAFPLSAQEAKADIQGAAQEKAPPAAVAPVQPSGDIATLDEGKNAVPAAPAAAVPAAPAGTATAEELKKMEINEHERMTAETIISEGERFKETEYWYKSALYEYEHRNDAKAIEAALRAISILRGKDNSIPQTAQSEAMLEQIRKLLGKCYYNSALALFYEAEKSSNAGNYELAMKYSDEAIEKYPDCKGIMLQMKAKYQRLKEASEYNQEIKFDTVDPDSADRGLSIAREIRIGQNFYKSKQWAKARDHFNAVIRQDPYNEVAIDYLRRIFEKLNAAGRARHDVMVLERAAEVAWDSVSPVLTTVDDAENDGMKFTPQEKVDQTKNIESKLKSIIIPSIDFEDFPLSEAVDNLRRRAQELDSDKNGVNIILLLSQNIVGATDKKEDGASDEESEEEEFEEGEESEEEESEEEEPEEGEESEEEEFEEGEESGEEASSDRSKFVIDYLKVEDVNLKTAIELVCEAAGVKYRVEPHAVIIADDKVPLEEYELKVFVVEKEALDIMNTQGEEKDGGGSGGDSDAEANANNTHIQKYLESMGITFPPGTAVKYDEAVSRLIVKNTPENIAAINEIVEQLNTEQTTQVLTQVKFVEVDLNDIEELGFEYTFSRNNNGTATLTDPSKEITAGTYTADQSFTLVYQPSFSDSESVLEGVEVEKPATYSPQTTKIEKGSVYVIPTESKGTYYTAPLNATSIYGSAVTFGANSQLVRNAQTDTSAYTNTSGVANDTVLSWSHRDQKGYDIDAKVHALDQADSTDILSTPRITTIAGQPAVIKMVTEKYYPDEWDEPTMESVSGNGNGNATLVFQPSIPTFGDAIEEGIVLNVTPQVEENFTITLQMTPVIQNFVGWTDYSFDMPLTAGNETRYVPNTLKMPIIEARTVETTVVSFDCETIVLGGVIKDRISIVEDQYPILGDIPFIGRLFQSKGRGSEKTSLLIFLTNRLIKPDGSPIRENQERGLPSFRY